MHRFSLNSIELLSIALTLGFAGPDRCAFGQTPAATLPYTLTFEPQQVPDSEKFPALQAYSWAVMDDGTWFIVGGRHNQGLHTFKTSGQNFPTNQANRFLWRIDPGSITATPVLDLKTLDPSAGDPLMATNQQGDYDPATGDWFIAGGYGWDTGSGKMRTFDTLVRIRLKEVVRLIQDASLSSENRQKAIAGAIEVHTDPFFAVTGGALRKLAGYFVLLFGQRFDGEYNPFGGTGFTQEYTEAVRYFTLKPGTLQINDKGELKSTESDRPFHRRDLPIVYDIDPATGATRIAAFGGVFPPGKIAAYTYPVHIKENFGQLIAVPDRTLNQRFSHYECPTIVVWDQSDGSVYHTFFGGIGHFYYHQSPAQKEVYDQVTKLGRNDGFPFVADISTVVQRRTGGYEEYIAPDPIPGFALNGASIEFIPNFKAGSAKVAQTGILPLQAFSQGRAELIGFIYGGINADFPLPKTPNQGTQATNSLYRVYLTRAPWKVIPADQGHEAIGYYTHGSKN